MTFEKAKRIEGSEQTKTEEEKIMAELDAWQEKFKTLREEFAAKEKEFKALVSESTDLGSRSWAALMKVGDLRRKGITQGEEWDKLNREYSDCGSSGHATGMKAHELAKELNGLESKIAAQIAGIQSLLRKHPSSEAKIEIE